MAVVVIRASAQSHVKLRAADKGQMPGAGQGHWYQHQDSQLTYYHRTNEEAENYSEHPEEPLTGREGGRLRVTELLPRLLAKSTHRLPSYPRQDEEETRCQHKEDQGDGEQAATEDKGSPLQRVKGVNVIIKSHLVIQTVC